MMPKIDRSYTPGVSDMVLTALVEARRLNQGPLSIEDLARSIYGADRPTNYKASLRCAIQRLRTGRPVYSVVGGYTLIEGEQRRPPIMKARVHTILGRIRSQSWQRRFSS